MNVLLYSLELFLCFSCISLSASFKDSENYTASSSDFDPNEFEKNMNLSYSSDSDVMSVCTADRLESFNNCSDINSEFYLSPILSKKSLVQSTNYDDMFDDFLYVSSADYTSSSDFEVLKEQSSAICLSDQIKKITIKNIPDNRAKMLYDFHNYILDNDADAIESIIVHPCQFSEKYGLQYSIEELCCQQDSWGRTILHIIGLGHKKIDENVMNKILYHGISAINKVDQQGDTPLHMSLYPQYTQALLAHGAHSYIQNNEGKTPLENLTALKKSHEFDEGQRKFTKIKNQKNIINLLRSIEILSL